MFIHKPTTFCPRQIRMVPGITSQGGEGEINLCWTTYPTNQVQPTHISVPSRYNVLQQYTPQSACCVFLHSMAWGGGGEPLYVWTATTNNSNINKITNSSSSMAQTFLHGSKMFSGSDWRGLSASSDTTMSKHSQNLWYSDEPLLDKLLQICVLYFSYAWLSTYFCFLHWMFYLNKACTFPRMLEAL